MILTHQVKWIAESCIRNVLHEYPGLVDRLLNGPAFETFIRMLTTRCNELDIAGYVPSKEALVLFIKEGAVMYAKRCLTKWGNLPDESEPLQGA